MVTLDVSSKVGGNFVKPLIRKGYYPARVVSIDMVKDKDGNVAVNKFGGKDLIVRFQVWAPDMKGNPTVPATFEEDTGGAKLEHEVELAAFTPFMGKDEKTGEEYSSITSKSKTTKMFEAMGWTFEAGGQLETDDFIGAWVELNVNDYTKKAEDGSETTFSVVEKNGVDVFKGTVSDAVKKALEDNKQESKPATKTTVDDYQDSVSQDMDIEVIDMSDDDDLTEDQKAQLKVFKDQVENGLITPEQFENIKVGIIGK